jgi:hypothetical protein
MTHTRFTFSLTRADETRMPVIRTGHHRGLRRRQRPRVPSSRRRRARRHHRRPRRLDRFQRPQRVGTQGTGADRGTERTPVWARVSTVTCRDRRPCLLMRPGRPGSRHRCAINVPFNKLGPGRDLSDEPAIYDHTGARGFRLAQQTNPQPPGQHRLTPLVAPNLREFLAQPE